MQLPVQYALNPWGSAFGPGVELRPETQKGAMVNCDHDKSRVPFGNNGIFSWGHQRKLMSGYSEIQWDHGDVDMSRCCWSIDLFLVLQMSTNLLYPYKTCLVYPWAIKFTIGNPPVSRQHASIRLEEFFVDIRSPICITMSRQDKQQELHGYPWPSRGAIWSMID